MIQFWEETRIHPKIGHMVVTPQGIFKGETGYKWHILKLVDNTRSGLEVSNWVGRWLIVVWNNNEGKIYRCSKTQKGREMW